MTLAEYRSKEGKGAGQGGQEGGDGSSHVTPAEYVKIGAALAFVTAIEVALFYADVAQWVLVTVLISLSALKFTLVALWFMHLRFDNRLFSGLFVGGLVLAVALFVVVLTTLGGKLA